MNPTRGRERPHQLIEPPLEESPGEPRPHEQPGYRRTAAPIDAWPEEPDYTPRRERTTGSSRRPRRRFLFYGLLTVLVVIMLGGGAAGGYFLLRDDDRQSNGVSVLTSASASTATTDPGYGADPRQTTDSSSSASSDTTQAAPTTESTAVQAVDLSSRATIHASSVLATAGSVWYGATNLVDDDPSTCWAEGVSGYGEGESIGFTFANAVTVSEFQIVPGYDKNQDGWDRWWSNGRLQSFALDFSDGAHEEYSVEDSRTLQTMTLNAPHTVTWVHLTITGVFEAADVDHRAEDTSISEFHLLGSF
jgi:hypothetical protein